MAPRHGVFVGQPKKRAERHDKHEWDKHRAKITNLYLEHDLDAVIRTMAEEESFVANKRQYVFQLGKWKVKKYRTGTGPTNGHHRRSSQRDDGLSGSVADDPAVNDHLYPAVPGVALRTNRSPIPEKRTLAGDFCLGACDDEMAFRTYLGQLELQDLASRAEEYFLIACARAARTPEHAQQIAGTITSRMELLSDREDADFDRVFSNLLLAYVHGSSSSEKGGKEKPQVLRYVTKAVDILLHERFSLQDQDFRRTSVFDMVAFMLLSYGLDVFVAHHDPDDKRSLHDDPKFKVLNEFMTVQDLRRKVTGKAARTTLRDCLDWCITALGSDIEDVPRELSELFSMRCPPECAGWKADTFVYCYLWHKWFHDYQSGSLPPWTVDSIAELGVGFADLLVTVVWSFMNKDEECSRKNQLRARKWSAKPLVLRNETSSRTMATTQAMEQNPDKAGSKKLTAEVKDPKPDTASAEITGKLRSPESLISHAKERAEGLRAFQEQELWANALDDFVWLNCPVERSPSEKQFELEAFQWTRSFIQRVLDVNLKDKIQLSMRGTGRSGSGSESVRASSSKSNANSEVDGNLAKMMDGLGGKGDRGCMNGLAGADEDEADGFAEGVDDDGDENMKEMNLE